MHYEHLQKLIKQTADKRTLQNSKYDKYYFNDTFKPLLNLGVEFEKLTIQRLIKYYNYDKTVKIYTNNNNKYDVLINNISYEIKADIRSITSNNLFIEFIQNSKLSGISTTGAEFYIFVIPYQIMPLFILIQTLEI